MSFDIFKQFATDESLENNGTWFPLSDTAEILVARTGNKAYAKKLSALVERNQKLLDMKNDAADAKGEEIMIEAMAETLLLGWKGLSFQGQDIEYSVANAKKLLSLRDFRRQVMKFADDTDAYRVKVEAEQGEA